MIRGALQALRSAKRAPDSYGHAIGYEAAIVESDAPLTSRSLLRSLLLAAAAALLAACCAGCGGGEPEDYFEPAVPPVQMSPAPPLPQQPDASPMPTTRDERTI